MHARTDKSVLNIEEVSPRDVQIGSDGRLDIFRTNTDQAKAVVNLSCEPGARDAIGDTIEARRTGTFPERSTSSDRCGARNTRCIIPGIHRQ